MKNKKEVKCIVDELPDKRIGMSREDHAYCPKCHPQPQHTPTPWAAIDSVWKRADGLYECAIVRPVTQTKLAMAFGRTEEEAKANAAFIVRAVNAHEELVKELRRVAEDMNTLVDNDEHWNRAQMREVLFAIQSNATNALAKAEGK